MDKGDVLAGSPEPGAAPPPPPAPPRPGRRPLVLVVLGVAAVVAVGATVVVSRSEREDALAGGGEPWSSEVAAGTYEVLTAGDAACGTTEQGTAYCLDAATGAERFPAEIADEFPGGAVLVVDVLARRQLVVLGSATGRRRWSQGLSGDHVDLAQAGDVAVVATPLDGAG